MERRQTSEAGEFVGLIHGWLEDGRKDGFGGVGSGGEESPARVRRPKSHGLSVGDVGNQNVRQVA